MTKVGGTTKKNKAKSPARARVQTTDMSASWTSPDSGIEVTDSVLLHLTLSKKKCFYVYEYSFNLMRTQ